MIQLRKLHGPSFPPRPGAAIIVGMPTYAYRCRECAESFELLRPMSESGAPASCPDGHSDTVKLLTTVALTGAAVGGSAPASGGGCCGGGCCGG
jgi:putative FmdB family regulatory protein